MWKKPKDYPNRTCHSFKFHYVSKIFVEKELKLLKRNKSAGVDNLPPGMLKDSAKQISSPLCHIINLSVKTSTFSNLWKQPKVIPVYKSGPTETPDNYRPISVLPSLSKVLEKAVHSQIITFFETNCLLSKHQFGYWSFHPISNHAVTGFNT